MTRNLTWATVAAVLTLGGAAFAQKGEAPKKVDPPKVVELALEDQTGEKHAVADLRGKVVVLVYGDKDGTDASRALGSKLHVLFHPTADGQTGEKARTAPVAALEGVAKGTTSPDVAVVPVAVCGKVPAFVQGIIKGEIKKGADVPVWLDFGTAMADKFGLRAGEPNLVVLDAEGRLRLKVNGAPDKETYQKVLQVAQNLRAEAAGLK